MINKLIVLMLCFSVSGCSVALALTGKKTRDVGLLRIGQQREEVLLNLGQPARTNTTDEGRIDVFELQRDNDPNVGRAIAHGFIDILTLGWWELLATPIELNQGKSFDVTVTYDTNEVVTKIRSTDK